MHPAGGGNRMAVFIEVKDLSLEFDGVKVLKNINLTINEGEVLGILGRSGSGKTVLMHVLRGVEEYEGISGQVIYHLVMNSQDSISSICITS